MKLQFNRPEEQVHTVECMMCGAQGDKEFMKERQEHSTTTSHPNHSGLLMKTSTRKEESRCEQNIAQDCRINLSNVLEKQKRKSSTYQNSQ